MYTSYSALRSARTLLAEACEETAAWVMREMQSPEGGYYSSLDADSEHEEGKYYVWTPEEVKGLAEKAVAGEAAAMAALAVLKS